jgi:MFS family permease
LTTTTASSPASIGYGELIRGNRNFRYLWLGQIVSLLGDWFNLIASASLIAILTQSGFAVGGLFVIRMLAPFLVSPVAGVVADRYNRKHILIITDIARALTVLGFLFVRNSGQVWLLYALTAIQLGISGFFFPTRNAILPDLVPPRGLGAANAISSATWSVMLALGAAIGGLVSGYWGIYPAFIIDSLTFLVSAVLIAQIKLDVKPALAAAERTVGASLQQYLDGLRYLGQHRDILVIALQKAAIALIMFSGFQVVQVAIAKDIFVLGIGGGISLGLMFGINGAGTGIGPIVARRFTGDRDRSLRLAILMGYFIGALGLAITGTLINFGTVLLGTLLRGVGGGIIWVFSTQLLLQLVPGHIRGRIFATEFAIFTLASAVGASVAGALLDSSIGISGLIWAMAVLSLIPAALWALWLGRGKAAELAPEDASA